MTINNQIRDEKIQYDINREAAKISALSSSKIHKYEYLTGEDILLSNQEQTIELTRFTYSPLGKAFGKQTKIIEDDGQKQIHALQSLIPKEQAKAITHDDESLGQKEESYNKLFEEKLDEIQELSKEIDYKNLNYNFTTKASGSINFIKSKGPFSLFKKIRDGELSLIMEEEDQGKCKREFSQIKSGNPKHNSEMQLYRIKKVKSLYDSRQKIIDLFNNYSKIKSEYIYGSKENETKGKGLKVLTPRQMPQRLPIALAQVKASNNSEGLLNEIRKFVYSLYKSKQISKKVYKNIIKSI